MWSNILLITVAMLNHLKLHIQIYVKLKKRFQIFNFLSQTILKYFELHSSQLGVWNLRYEFEVVFHKLKFKNNNRSYLPEMHNISRFYLSLNLKWSTRQIEWLVGLSSRKRSELFICRNLEFLFFLPHLQEVWQRKLWTVVPYIELALDEGANHINASYNPSPSQNQLNVHI